MSTGTKEERVAKAQAAVNETPRIVLEQNLRKENVRIANSELHTKTD